MVVPMHAHLPSFDITTRPRCFGGTQYPPPIRHPSQPSAPPLHKFWKLIWRQGARCLARAATCLSPSDALTLLDPTQGQDTRLTPMTLPHRPTLSVLHSIHFKVWTHMQKHGTKADAPMFDKLITIYSAAKAWDKVCLRVMGWRGAIQGHRDRAERWGIAL